MVGIGGIGMSALARFFVKNNYFVAGYDLTKTPLTEELENEQIFITYSEEIEEIPQKIIADKDNSIVIYTPAIPKNHKQFNFFQKNNYKIFKRAEILGLLSQKHKTIGIAGTHGKTTISAICSHIFRQTEKLNSAFVGGIVKQYNNNFIEGSNNSRDWLILEADEFDKSFLKFEPNISLISAIEEDHLDIYDTKNELVKSFEKYAQKTSEKVIINEKVQFDCELESELLKYGFEKNSDFYAENIRIKNNSQVFDIIYPNGKCTDVVIKLPGKVNVENATAAFSVAYTTGIATEEIKKSLANFEGIHRRFDEILNNEKYTFINDYAHHPTEIRRLREAVQSFYPRKKTTVIFQPHLYSRTRDFADGFARELSEFDKILLLDIYPAREKPIAGVSSEMILEKITNPNKEMCSFSNILEKIKNMDVEILLTVGAGSIINIVDDIKNILK